MKTLPVVGLPGAYLAQRAHLCSRQADEDIARRRPAGSIGGRVERGSLAGGARLGGQSREGGRARTAGLGPGLLESRERGPQALVGLADLRLEVIEGLIVEHRPPAPARRRVRGRRYLPLAGLLVRGGRSRHRWALVARAERARLERQHHGEHRQRRSGPHQECPAAVLATAVGGGATRTGIPSAIESGGLTMRVSAASIPVSTSISVPKSRPWV